MAMTYNIEKSSEGGGFIISSRPQLPNWEYRPLNCTSNKETEKENHDKKYLPSWYTYFYTAMH
jgi:hypothetical protein